MATIRANKSDTHARGRKPNKPVKVPVATENGSKYTEAVVTRICNGLERGLTRELAAAYGGISRSTFYAWIDEKPEFADRLEAVEAEAAAHWLDQIDASAEIDWRAAAWKLERRHPLAYGQQPVKHEVTGRNGDPIGFRLVDARAVLTEIAAGSETDS